MSILLLLIPISVLFVCVAGAAFFWAVNQRQFDDVDAAAFLPMADGIEPEPEPGSDPTGRAGTDVAEPVADRKRPSARS